MDINWKKMEKRQLRIAIVGGIAVGKTTVARQLSNMVTNSLFLEEDVSENLFLPEFYSDMKRWAFHSRISTLAMMINNYTKSKNIDNSIIIMDRCIDELITFATLQYDMGNLTNKEFTTYKELYEGILALEEPIDLYIYCKCSEECSLTRIKSRNRIFEQNIDADYLKKLNSIYDMWISESSKRYITIDTETDCYETIRKLAEYLNEKHLS